MERKTTRKRHAPGAVASADAVDHEVVRANRVLAAYFRGQRTEREALAALKIIKGFIKNRERTDPSKRPGLPGVRQARPRSNSHKPARAAARSRREVRPPEAIGENSASDVD